MPGLPVPGPVRGRSGDTAAQRRTGRDIAPLPETKPTPVETPEPGNEEKPAGELSAIREQAEKIIPGYRCRHLVQQLDDRMLEDFLAIYQAVANFRTEVEFPSSISMDEMEALMTLIMGTARSCSRLDGNATYYYNSVDRDGEKMVTGISELSYHMDEDTYRRAYQQCDRIVQEVVSRGGGPFCARGGAACLSLRHRPLCLRPVHAVLRDALRRAGGRPGQV